MAIETNKQIMRLFTEFINTASEKLAYELIATDAIFHVPGRPEPIRGPAGYLAIIAMMRSGFPDIQWTLEEMIAENERVAARFTMRGTHKGAFFGVPPQREQDPGPGHELLSSFERPVYRRVRRAGPAWTAAAIWGFAKTEIVFTP